MLKVTRFLFCLAVALVFVAGARHAYADEFQITWTGGYGPGNAIITATNDGGGLFTVTAITGTQNGATITGLLPLQGYGGNDNDVFPSSSPVLDYHGFAFVAGGADYNLFFDNNPLTNSNVFGSYDECVSTVTPCGLAPDVNPAIPLTSFSITSTPEPSSAFLLLTGLLGLVMVIWSKRLILKMLA